MDYILKELMEEMVLKGRGMMFFARLNFWDYVKGNRKETAEQHNKITPDVWSSCETAEGYKQCKENPERELAPRKMSGS